VTVQEALRRGVNYLTIQGDSKLVINQVRLPACHVS
jgi:hypothetical protein